MNVEERFWAKVDRRGPDDCWEWTGSRDNTGYGRIKDGGSQVAAHRVSWKLHNGPIPDGLFACHHCDNRKCVNPKHLFLGTAKENTADMLRKGRSPLADNKGAANPRCRLSEADVIAIRSSNETVKQIAARYGVGRAYAWRLKNGDAWKHLNNRR